MWKPLFSLPPLISRLTGSAARARGTGTAARSVNAMRIAFFIVPWALDPEDPYHETTLSRRRCGATPGALDRLKVDRAAVGEPLEGEDLLDRLRAHRRIGGQRHHRPLAPAFGADCGGDDVDSL